MVRFRALFASVAVGALLAMAGTGTAQAAPGVRSAAAAGTAGCGAAPGLASGNHTISSGGQNRGYILRIPANYDNSHPYRLFVGLHWRGGTADDVDSGGTDGYNWSYYGLRRLADSAGNTTIFVAPQGNGNGWANPGGQDVTFVDDLLRQLEAALCVDTSQVFAAWIQLRRGHELRARLRPAAWSSARSPSTPGRTSAGAAAAPSPSRTSVSTASGTTFCPSRPDVRCATSSSGTTAARRRTRPVRRRAA